MNLLVLRNMMELTAGPLDSYRETLDLKYDQDETVSEALRH